MKIRVVLHSVLRERLPPETNGKADLELPEGCTVQEVIHRLGLPEHVSCAINGQIERSLHKILQDGDEVRFFRPGAGG